MVVVNHRTPTTLRIYEHEHIGLKLVVIVDSQARMGRCMNMIRVCPVVSEPSNQVEHGLAMNEAHW